MVETGGRAPSGRRPRTVAALTAAVAANLYKLTAYKDEYEVARLMTDEDGLAAARLVGRRRRVDGRGSCTRPCFGRWAWTASSPCRYGPAPGVKLLARGKRLRGTMADPFGRAEVRRVERKLPQEYVTAIDAVLARLTATNLAAAVELALLPDLVRGYEDIKLANVKRYRSALSERLAEFSKSSAAS